MGGLGKNALLVGAIGGFVALTGSIDVILEFVEEYWVVIWIGSLVLFASLPFFGIAALRRKPFPRWNGLPLFAGIWVPTALLIGAITGGEFRNSDAMFAAFVLVPAVSLLPLGYLLQADAPREAAMA